MTLELTQVADGVHVVSGTNVNWALVSDGSAVTIIDAGYPLDGPRVLASVDAIGHHPRDVTAVLLTHAHLDHVGGVPHVLRGTGARVVTGAEEARHARGDYLDQASLARVLAQARTPSGARWVARTLRASNGHVRVRLREIDVAPLDRPVDAPGNLVAVPTPGHTPGHTAWLMPSTGVLFSGDALVTGHPLCHHDGPQPLPSLFNHDDDAVLDSIAGLRDVPAEVVVPGHGRPLGAALHDVVDAVLEHRGRRHR